MGVHMVDGGDEIAALDKEPDIVRLAVGCGPWLGRPNAASADHNTWCKSYWIDVATGIWPI
jgi:hypothetical protein